MNLFWRPGPSLSFIMLRKVHEARLALVAQPESTTNRHMALFSEFKARNCTL